MFAGGWRQAGTRRIPQHASLAPSFLPPICYKGCFSHVSKGNDDLALIITSFSSKQRIIELEMAPHWHSAPRIPSLIPFCSTGCSWPQVSPAAHHRALADRLLQAGSCRQEHNMAQPFDHFCSKAFKIPRKAGCPATTPSPLGSALPARLWLLQSAGEFIAGEMQCSNL